MRRREFLIKSGEFALQTAAASFFASNLAFKIARAADTLPLSDLISSLNPSDGLVLTSQSSEFAAYLINSNKRVALSPQAKESQVRVLCKTPQAVSIAIQWARTNKVPLAARCGGHSYEGFSQSSGLVIDLRQMNQVDVDPASSTAQVGSGASLGNVYSTLSKHQLAIPAGSCPTVGVSGHTLGGGFGLLGRPLGLACDSLEKVELVDAQGNQIVASSTENSDLFWALRGGGGGSFGIATKLHFKGHRVPTVVTFGIGWTVNANEAADLFLAWQNWVGTCPAEITPLIKIQRKSAGVFGVRVYGQTVGSDTNLRKALAVLQKVNPGAQVTSQSRPFMDAVKHFGGSFEYSSYFMKGKSDYIKTKLSREGVHALLTALNQSPIIMAVMFDTYGGKVAEPANDSTAFAHRDAICSVQYYAQWETAAQTPKFLKAMSDVYSAMRPYFSGNAYINYCDLDVENYPRAYWGQNLERLVKIKAAFDPENFFNNAQSVPLKI